MVTTTELIRTTMFLTKEQHEKLRRLAFEKRKSMSSLLREAVLQMLEDEEDIRDGMQALADEEGTISLEEYEMKREGRKPQHELLPSCVKEGRPETTG
jgi:hypothetical protein